MQKPLTKSSSMSSLKEIASGLIGPKDKPQEFDMNPDSFVPTGKSGTNSPSTRSLSNGQKGGKRTSLQSVDGISSNSTNRSSQRSVGHPRSSSEDSTSSKNGESNSPNPSRRTSISQVADRQSTPLHNEMPNAEWDPKIQCWVNSKAAVASEKSLQKSASAAPTSDRGLKPRRGSSAVIDPPSMSQSGSIELGCLLRLLHDLLSVHEVKFTLQLLEDFMSSRPGKYVLDTSLGEFAQDLQRASDAVGASHSADEPTSMIESLLGNLGLARASGKQARVSKTVDNFSWKPGVGSSSVPERKKEQSKSRTSIHQGGVLVGQRESFSAPRPSSSSSPPGAASRKSSRKSLVQLSDISEPALKRIPDNAAQEAAASADLGNVCSILPGAPATDVEDMDSPRSPTDLHTSWDDIPPIDSQMSDDQASDKATRSQDSFERREWENAQPVEDSMGENFPGWRSQSHEPSNGSAVFGEIHDSYTSRFDKGAESPQIEPEKIEDNEIDLDDVSMEQAAYLAAPSDRFVVHPSHRRRVVLDILVLVLIIIECVTLPLGLAFQISLPEPFHVLSLVLFGTDFMMSFTTGYYHNDLLIMRRRRVLRHYLKTWFVLDLISLVPWDEIVQLASIGGAGSEGSTRTTFVRILKLGKLLRVLRLLRLAKINALIKRLQGAGILASDLRHLKFGMSVGKMFVIFGFLSHWGACIFGWLGHPDNVGFDDALNPHALDECAMGGPCEGGIEGSPWRHRYGLDNYDAVIHYFTALQYATALLTGGESPLQASRPVERLFAIIVMICSVFNTSVVVGEILRIMNRQAEARMLFDEQSHQANEFMAARKVPQSIQVRVYRHLETQHNINYGHSSSNREFMSQLSDQIQRELVEYLNSSTILQHPFFGEIQDWEAVKQLCLGASPVIFAPDDVVVEMGAPATCCHFVVRGKLRVQNPVVQSSKVLYLKPPCWLGDLCLFIDMTRKSTVTAVVMTETLMLGKQCLEEVCDDFPHVRAHWEEFRDDLKDKKFGHITCDLCHDVGHTSEMCPERHKHGMGHTVSGTSIPLTGPNLPHACVPHLPCLPHLATQKSE